MPNQYPTYKNRIKTPVKTTARIAIDLMKEIQRSLKTINVNSYTAPTPPSGGGVGVEDGTADGQLLYWDNIALAWLHTEVTEVWWDDTNKGVGIGKDSATPPMGTFISVVDDTLNKSASFSGIICSITKTAGASDINDDFYGINAGYNLNQAGGEIGNAAGTSTGITIADGTVKGTQGAHGIRNTVVQSGGTIDVDLHGIYSSVIQSGGTTTGNIYGIRAITSAAGIVTGTVYCAYLADGAGTDYCLYQVGSAPNILRGDLHLDGASTELRFYEGVNYVGFKAPPLAANQIWVLPDADGAAGELLGTDGGGNLGWYAAGGGGTPVTNVNFAMSPYIPLAADYSLFCDTTAGNIVINLPTAVGISGKIYVIKHIRRGGVNTVTINANGAETIDGLGAIILLNVYTKITIQSDGANWFIIV